MTAIRLTLGLLVAFVLHGVGVLLAFSAVSRSANCLGGPADAELWTWTAVAFFIAGSVAWAVFVPPNLSAREVAATVVAVAVLAAPVVLFVVVFAPHDSSPEMEAVCAACGRDREQVRVLGMTLLLPYLSYLQLDGAAHPTAITAPLRPGCSGCNPVVRSLFSGRD